jgi:LPS-assembly lipoprotein
VLAALLAGPVLAGCGFTPVYGPGGAGGRLQGRVALESPDAPAGYAFTRRFEDRMGRASGPYRLETRLQTDQQDLGATSAGAITRYRILGRVFYALRDTDGTVLAEGRTNAFTGYSTTGSTVATLAAERDAQARLMVLLADQVIDGLLLNTDGPRVGA